ncbi:hypothetical protein ACF0H5_020197 [Mactra antiquata]
MFYEINYFVTAVTFDFNNVTTSGLRIEILDTEIPSVKNEYQALNQHTSHSLQTIRDCQPKNNNTVTTATPQ